MKTLLKNESKIQEFLVSIFLLTIIIAFIAKVNFFSWALVVEFFLIAIFQYSINLIKFFQTDYTKTQSKKLYVLISTYGVLAIMGLLSFKFFDLDYSSNIFGIFIWSLMILPPILIIQSLRISYSDKTLKNEKSNH